MDTLGGNVKLNSIRNIKDKDWHNCYRRGWGQDLIPAAYAHPAKVAKGLTRRIYAYAVERGWLKIGDTCLDPFAGISGFALDAMFHGLHWIGVELEDKFVQLGQQNIDLWNCRYGNGKLRHWGTAVILQGDSRNLVEVLEGTRAEGIISSPPFSSILSDRRLGGGIDVEKLKHARKPSKHSQVSIAQSYGTSPAQLGNMPTGEPPADYTHTPGSLTVTQFDAGAVAESATFTTAPRRGESIECEWEEGDVDAVIASPPYSKSLTGGGEAIQPRSGDVRKYARKMTLDENYGTSDGQLAALPEGEPPMGIVSSPPHEGSMDSGDENAERRAERTNGFKQGMSTFRYGQNPYTFLSKDPSGLSNEQRHELAAQNPQVGALKQDTFWEAAKAILLQCHQVLAPGGVAIWVVKDFVRNKKRVDFTGQWRALCESCGFETIEVIKAWLVEGRGTQYDLMGEGHTMVVERKSFFRRLYEFKARAAKFWESVTRDDKAGYLWQAHGELWQSYHEQMLDDTRESPPPLPTHTRILSAAQSLAYREAGEPDVEIDTQIDYEVVLVMRKAMPIRRPSSDFPSSEGYTLRNIRILL